MPSAPLPPKQAKKVKLNNTADETLGDLGKATKATQEYSSHNLYTSAFSLGQSV